eukprot:364500-Chlamydomonas_euryale.AAC.12
MVRFSQGRVQPVNGEPGREGHGMGWPAVHAVHASTKPLAGAWAGQPAMHCRSRGATAWGA